MSNFEYDSFSPLHPVRLLRSDLEDLERALNLMKCCYDHRISDLESEMEADFEAMRQRIRQMKKVDYWSWR